MEPGSEGGTEAVRGGETQTTMRGARAASSAPASPQRRGTPPPRSRPRSQAAVLAQGRRPAGVAARHIRHGGSTPALNHETNCSSVCLTPRSPNSTPRRRRGRRKDCDQRRESTQRASCSCSSGSLRSGKPECLPTSLLQQPGRARVRSVPRHPRWVRRR